MTSSKQSNQSYIEMKDDGWIVMTEDVDVDIDGNKLPIDGHCSIMCGNLVIKPNEQYRALCRQIKDVESKQSK